MGFGVQVPQPPFRQAGVLTGQAPLAEFTHLPEPSQYCGVLPLQCVGAVFGVHATHAPSRHAGVGSWQVLDSVRSIKSGPHA